MLNSFPNIASIGFSLKDGQVDYRKSKNFFIVVNIIAMK